ncbi:DUF1439 domain-containing protein [Alteromonas sp. 1_MG-2023]|uniref:DUF1439 domain-containing protein n=1 Tax=Alteromonas sp. 1_MG-2023 TaxID=3062669 RepID=UPI0026E3CF95|nr:DUF1439 domain-containing protein [Alteromonas sp. 1_MG-2023]MDO6568705.1 DUF1439 domain-containing protein [Alteromonas sp. 1_MG-2023]
MKLELRDRGMLLISRLLIKLGKLRYDQFSVDELNTLLSENLPQAFPLVIPVGNAHVAINSGKVSLNATANRLSLQLLASITITLAETTIYRAHLVITLSAEPHYNDIESTLYFINKQVDNIAMVNDDYALIKDTQFLLSRFVPGNLNGLFSRSLKSALSIVTVGTSDQAAEYLALYLSGSKQAVLDFHKPQIERAILNKVATLPLHHKMREDQWREVLFSRYGKSVNVEPDALRFYF